MLVSALRVVYDRTQLHMYFLLKGAVEIDTGVHMDDCRTGGRQIRLPEAYSEGT